jgi:hypothetical protein
VWVVPVIVGLGGVTGIPPRCSLLRVALDGGAEVRLSASARNLM